MGSFARWRRTGNGRRPTHVSARRHRSAQLPGHVRSVAIESAVHCPNKLVNRMTGLIQRGQGHHIEITDGRSGRPKAKGLKVSTDNTQPAAQLPGAIPAGARHAPPGDPSSWPRIEGEPWQ
ncbi:hypothetical protein GCM10023195_55990 [Actinoallomurus liliacearum]|uniref:Uncharacterized protein n=1 Tax=Actinoallomurus liliacearum TaxID=1080073 RepID=A0ABP8TP95_9ACTN